MKPTTEPSPQGDADETAPRAMTRGVTRVRRVGNSLGVILRRDVLELLGVGDGAKIETRVSADGEELVLKPKRELEGQSTQEATGATNTRRKFKVAP